MRPPRTVTIEKAPAIRLASFLALVLLLALYQLLPGYVYFHTQQGALQHWMSGDFPLTYRINSGGCEDIVSFSTLESAIQQSFAAWQNAPLADLGFSYLGSTSSTSRTNDGTNLIAFDTQSITASDGDFIVSEDLDPSVVGITINTFYASTGQIIDSDIIFNDRAYQFTTTAASDLSRKIINLQDVATHEIGHMLGLDHTYLEHATMFPYARQGQSTLAEDDAAGIASIYPGSQFESQTDSLFGRVTRSDGNPVWGVYVSAYSPDTGDELVAGITDEEGYYSIKGLGRSTAYKLRVRTVDLDHLGGYIKNGGDRTEYIPEYYDDAYRFEDATAVATGQGFIGNDFELETATILASYDRGASYQTTIISTPKPTSGTHMLAVKFPKEELPAGFNIFGMSFFNNDLHMEWPQIMLTTGTESEPDISSPLRLVEDYEGQETDMSNVEWETIQLTNSRDLWVVFQFPDQPTYEGVGDGPAIGTEGVSPYRRVLYYSTNSGQTFYQYPSYQYDPIVYLTMSVADVQLAPVVEISTVTVDFGYTKAGGAKILAVPFSNVGNADLTLSSFISNKIGFYSAWADNATIGPGVTDSIRIQFTPGSSTTAINGTITIMTNDQTRPAVDIPVSGQGAYPVAAAGAASLEFGEVEVGQSSTLPLPVTNTGPVELVLSGFDTGSQHFSVSADTVRVPAGITDSVEVVFAPQSAGPQSAELVFATDDPNNASMSVSLAGSATGGGSGTLACDFTDDGASDLADVLAFLLLARTNPDDPRLDWNGSGAYSIADALSLLMDIRLGNCAESAVLAGGTGGSEEWRAGLDSGEIQYLESMIRRLGTDADLAHELRLALYGEPGGGPTLPRAFSLAQNRPNPFNPTTAISFTVPEGGGEHVSIEVYDIRGRLVRTLVDDYRMPGEHTVFWDGTDQAGREAVSGVYIYRMRAGGRTFTRKMVMLK